MESLPAPSDILMDHIFYLSTFNITLHVRIISCYLNVFIFFFCLFFWYFFLGISSYYLHIDTQKKKRKGGNLDKGKPLIDTDGRRMDPPSALLSCVCGSSSRLGSRGVAGGSFKQCAASSAAAAVISAKQRREQAVGPGLEHRSPLGDAGCLFRFRFWYFLGCSNFFLGFFVQFLSVGFDFSF